MKRVRCPKCDNYIIFDETKYMAGQSLVFECTECHKQFSIRIGKSKLAPLQKDMNQDTPEETDEETFGNIIVIENVFAYKQIFSLKLGDNVIGRYEKGTDANIAIETSDPSMDRRHCIINVQRNKQGKVKYTLRDAPSNTGTFLMNEILGDKERVNIEDGAVITLGATSIILSLEDK
ncbi:MAG: FHA domain-containing protein [Bacteroidaceae bacterium]|nr:FHA domain-containing protein [Bacteroidaceae bacterium]